MTYATRGKRNIYKKGTKLADEDEEVTDNVSLEMKKSKNAEHVGNTEKTEGKLKRDKTLMSEVNKLLLHPCIFSKQQ